MSHFHKLAHLGNNQEKPARLREEALDGMARLSSHSSTIEQGGPRAQEWKLLVTKRDPPNVAAGLESHALRLIFPWLQLFGTSMARAVLHTESF